MPLECERLMGWPDGHTAEGVDERGRRFTLSDSARYRLCGNGVGAPHAEWLGRRLLEVLEADPLSLAA
jgi:site-specific DNA-cytosine methylase